MNRVEDQNNAMIAAYEDEAEACGWFGPEVAFGMAYKYVQPGQSILDIGIGTGLGSVLFRKAGLKVYGMDISPKMLDGLLILAMTRLQWLGLEDESTVPVLLQIIELIFSR